MAAESSYEPRVLTLTDSDQLLNSVEREDKAGYVCADTQTLGFHLVHTQRFSKSPIARPNCANHRDDIRILYTFYATVTSG